MVLHSTPCHATRQSPEIAVFVPEELFPQASMLPAIHPFLWRPPVAGLNNNTSHGMINTSLLTGDNGIENKYSDATIITLGSSARAHPSRTPSPASISSCSSNLSTPDISGASSSCSSPDSLSFPEFSQCAEKRNKKKLRTTYSIEQVQRMEILFYHNQYPSTGVIEQLAMEFGIPEQRIRVWFQNKRARCKRRTRDSSSYPCHPLQSAFAPYPAVHNPPMSSLPVRMSYPNQPASAQLPIRPSCGFAPPFDQIGPNMATTFMSQLPGIHTFQNQQPLAANRAMLSGGAGAFGTIGSTCPVSVPVRSVNVICSPDGHQGYHTLTHLHAHQPVYNTLPLLNMDTLLT